MNIKDKLTICLVVILVIVLGFVLKSDASGSVMGQTSDKGLALLAKNDIEKFIMTNPDSSSWFTQSLDTYIGANKSDATITQSSATCLYEEEAYTDGSKYYITNVININWDPSINDYHAYGWWKDSSKPNGIAGGELTSINRDYNKLVQLDIFLQAMYNAYKSNKTHYTTTEKSAMKSYFYKGIDTGGFLTVDDGVGLNIDPDFLGIWNGEALTYKDPDSSYNAQDLINKYNANNNAGVGLTINGESTCIKQKDTDGDYTIFGPFNIHFVRKINSISIVGDAKSYTDYDGGEIYYSTSYNKYDTAEWSNQLSNIPANTNFYIKISDSGQEFYNQSPNITITFNQKSIQTYQGRMILLKSGGHGQNLMIYAARKNDPYTASVQYSVEKVEKKENTLRVVKYGVSGSQETKQTGVGFIISKDGKYLVRNNIEGYIGQEVQLQDMEYNDTYFSWVEERNNATIFETVDGYFQIKNIPEGTYFIGEVYNKNQGYEDSLITRCRLERYNGDTLIDDKFITDIVIKDDNMLGYTDNKLQVVTISIQDDGYMKTLNVYDSNEDDSFNIYINKINSSGKKLENVNFQIKVLDENREFRGWLSEVNNIKYSYTAYNNVATFTTNSNGTVTIENLDKNYFYEIYESKAASGYTLEYQKKNNNMKVIVNGSELDDYGYRNVDLGHDLGNKYLVYCGTVSYTDYKTSVDVEVTNVRKPSNYNYVDISGKVWLDGRTNKSDAYDGKYGTVNDTYLEKVKVYLKNSNTDSVKADTETDENGYYKFDKSSTYLRSSDLENYYIEIDYSTAININKDIDYSIVKFGTGTDESKAEYHNGTFAGTESINSSYNLHMNIGLKPVSTDTQSVEKLVDNIKVVMKGVPYTYKYGQNNDNVGGGATVGVGNASYYRTIYASDIVYSTQDDVTDGLQIYITYKIKISNDTKTWEGGSDPSLGDKQEHYMTVNVKDIYDSTCYELVEDGNWEGNNGIATYNKPITLYNKNYMPSQIDTITVPITFKLTDGKKSELRNALKEILEKGSFTASNKVEISGQHEYNEYIRYRYKTKTGKKKWRYTWETKYLSYEEEDYAPGMTFSIYEGDGSVAQRTISGTVFEDKTLDSDILETQDRKGEIIGDGLYDSLVSNGEGTVENVTVELLEHGKYKASGKNAVVAKRYSYYVEEDEEGNKIGVGKIETDSVDTNRDGIYTISGIIPGDYYIRFSYGADKDNDGKGDQVIYLNTHNKNVTAYDYKSTILSEETSITSNKNLQDLIQNDINETDYAEESDYYWYGKVLNGYSTAVDILQDRENLNNQDNKMYNMRAYTPTFRISLENERDSEGQRLDEGTGKKEYFYEIKNMNFGIIDTPEIELGFEKVMTNIRVTNAAGQIIVDGNPANQGIKYLSNLDKKTKHLTHGSDYAKIEIKDEELYGAELEITYAITIRNNSDVNYYEDSTSDEYGHYYMFGKKSKEASITINQVYDYLDEKLTLIDSDRKDDLSQNNNMLYINKWKSLYSQNGTEKTNRFTQDTAIIKTTRILANDSDDNMEFKNTAKVYEMEVTSNPKLIENLDMHQEKKTSNIEGVGEVNYDNYFDYTEDSREEPYENPSIQNYLTITPPTGADMNTIMIYITAIAVAGIIITIGIIVIKKKVLNK